MIQPQFDAVQDFSEGSAGVCVGPCDYVEIDEPAFKGVSIKAQVYQGKWGFIDTNGKMTANPRFSSLGQLHHGLASATTGERRLYERDQAPEYGYVDKTGALVIPEQFYSAYDFDDDGMAGACVGNSKSNRCGFIDTTGKFVVNPQFYRAMPFKDGLAMVFENKDSSASYIDRKGRLIWKGDAVRPKTELDDSH